MQIHGVINGKHIELEHETGLPSGSNVIVNIQPKSLTLEEKQRLVDSLCGTWAEDDSLKTIFAEFENERTITPNTLRT